MYSIHVSYASIMYTLLSNNSMKYYNVSIKYFDQRVYQIYLLMLMYAHTLHGSASST